MRYPLLDRRLGPGQVRVVVLFALVNVPALVLVSWLGVNLYARHATGGTIELSEPTTASIVAGLVGGLAGNLLLYRGVTGVASRLAAALDECSEQKRRAESAGAAKGRFLANINHDVRTRLNGVLGMVQVLSVGELSPEQAKHMETLKRSAEELSRMLEGMLKGCEAGSGELLALPQAALPHAALLLSSDAADRVRLGGLLADAGCSVVAVADGQSGMTELVRGVVEGSPFTLIVMTDEWTESDEEWLRQVEQSPARCPAIVLSRESSLRELRAALARA
jgi:signal transduction histidine kinase